MSMNRCMNRGLDRYNHLPGRARPDAYLQDLIVSNTQPGDAVLEVGFHEGNNLVPLLKHPNAFQVYGAEQSDKLVRRLKNRFDGRGWRIIPAWASQQDRLHVARWSLGQTATPFPWPEMKGQFKAISAVHVLSHFSTSTLTTAVGQLSEYLAPGGLLAVTVLRSGAHTFDAEDDDHTTGLIFHSDDDLSHAFAGLRFVATAPASAETAQAWNLPQTALKWLVFRKPETPAASLSKHTQPGVLINA
ncbi:MAG: class I SAM-dependent methyltransferase [Cyanobacteria bacterium HKST-UBA06]|nr:class I SAM-dependent methyltransferase [Cyanobacteria bacterium HKST-UBA06]